MSWSFFLAVFWVTNLFLACLIIQLNPFAIELIINRWHKSEIKWVLAFVLIIVGLLHINIQNSFVDFHNSILTIIGYMICLKGFSHLAFPEATLAFSRKLTVERPALHTALAISIAIILILGILKNT